MCIHAARKEIPQVKVESGMVLMSFRGGRNGVAV
jgi:hypothetical protein